MRAAFASPLGFLVGFALGALGGGGSILSVPALVYVAGQSPRDATTSSLLIVAAASAFGLVAHWRAGRVRWAQGAVFGAVGIGGSVVGTALNRHISADALLAGFAALIAIAAWRMLTACPSCTRVGESEVTAAAPPPQGSVTTAAAATKTARLALVVAAGTAVGLLTGVFGVGGGFVIVPALTLALRFNMPDAIGTSLLVITINALTALAARGGAGSVDWAVAGPFLVAACGGVAAGVRAADRLPARRLLRWFAGLLFAVAVFTAGQVAWSVLGR